MAPPTNARETSNDTDLLAEFRDLSRQMLYMALFDNEDIGLSIFSDDETDSEEGGAETDFDLLPRLSRYLYQQLEADFPDPGDLTIEEWVDMAEQVQGEDDQDEIDYSALADRLYRMLKRELRIEQERLARRRF